MSYLLVIALIGLLVLIHELGHLVGARLVGIPVARFSVGLGPSLWAVRIGGTEYRLSAIPFGGYVMPAVETMDGLFRISAWKRAVFFASGPLANLLLPIPLFATLSILQDGFSVVGVTITPIEQTWHILGEVLAAFSGLWGHTHAIVGSIGLVIEGSNFVGLTPTRAIQFAIFMSLNLAILNLLPVPILDGGRLLLLPMEHRFPHWRRLHLGLALTGWCIVAGITVYATVVDVGRYCIN